MVCEVIIHPVLPCTVSWTVTKAYVALPKWIFFYIKFLRKKEFSSSTAKEMEINVHRNAISKLLRKQNSSALTLSPPCVHYSNYSYWTIECNTWQMPHSGFLLEKQISIPLSRLICEWITRYVQQAHRNATEREKEYIFSFLPLLIKSGLPSLGISISHDSGFYSVYFRSSLVSNMWGLSCPIVSAWHFLAHLYFHPSLFTVITLINCICWQFMMKWGKKFLQTVRVAHTELWR